MAFCFLFGGCKKEDALPAVPLQEVWTEHETEGSVLAYTLDEEGNLYTFEFEERSQEESDRLTPEEPVQMTRKELLQMTSEDVARLYQRDANCLFLRKYTAKGERIYSKALKNTLCSYVRTMAVKDGILYFTPYTEFEGNLCTVLYSYCPETEELVAVKELPYFQSVSRILPMEGEFYFLGTNTVDMQGKDSRKYRYTGERIFCYAPAEDRLTELGIEEPMDICVAEEGKLCVYAHRGEEFCLLLYDTDRETMKVMAKTREYKMANVAFCKERQGVIYQASGGGLVLSVLPDLETESELYPGGLFWDNNLCYINGMVACTAMNSGILQFPLERVKCENKALRYITTGESVSKPFGCGYEIQRRVLEPDKFALKVMALDRDFDICFVDSGDSFGYQLKEKGLFYPLNEVAGIQEYLDACFPYVKEAATDEDGNVWMLPVAVDIRSLLVSREAADKVIIRENMTYEEYVLAYDALSEEEKRVTEKPSSFAETFLVRYILSRGTVDTEEFRRILQGMAESESVQQEETKGVYCRVFGERDYRAYFVRQYGTEATIYAEPKLSATDKNTGSCLFLAVNPYSDNLDTALQYISAWIAYTMGREDAPLFFAEREVADTPYDRSLYQLYRNGAIVFSVEDELYEGYSEVLNGTENLEEYVSRTEARVDMFLNE